LYWIIKCFQSATEEQVTKFTGFLLVAEPSENSKRTAGTPINLGTLQLMPGIINGLTTT